MPDFIKNALYGSNPLNIFFYYYFFFWGGEELGRVESGFKVSEKKDCFYCFCTDVHGAY